MEFINNFLTDLETIRVEVDTAKLAIILTVLAATIVVGIVIKRLLLPPIVKAFDKDNDSFMEIVTEELMDLPYKAVISIGLYFALISTDTELKVPFIFGVVQFILVIIILYYFVQVLNVGIRRYAYRKAKNTLDKSMASAYVYGAGIFRMLAWVFAVLFVFGNLGYDVSALLAGLGISGVAVAFAFRNLIKDVIGSFLIIFDKPIRIGDFIDGADYRGVVKKIGIKSTSLTSEEGNEVIVPNTLIVDKTLVNYKSRRKFSESINIGVDSEIIKKKDFDARNLIASMLDSYMEDKSLVSYLITLKSSKTEGLEYSVKLNINIDNQTLLEELLEQIMTGLYGSLYGKSKKGEVRIERGE